MALGFLSGRNAVGLLRMQIFDFKNHAEAIPLPVNSVLCFVVFFQSMAGAQAVSQLAPLTLACQTMGFLSLPQ